MIPTDRAVANHQRRHHRLTEIEDCHTCQDLWNTCQSNRIYLARTVADLVADAINEREDYVEPMIAYRCYWGARHWHLTHATKPKELKKIRKAKRLWLASKGHHA